MLKYYGQCMFKAKYIVRGIVFYKHIFKSNETIDWYSSSAGRPLRFSDNGVHAPKTAASLWTNFAKSG